MNDLGRGPGETSGYEIRMRGHISDRWSDWFEGMDLVHESDGMTLLRALELDQAGLHGLLAKVRDLGLPLVSITPIPNTTTRRSNR